MEKLMHYVWQHKLWTGADMTTVDGHRLRVIDPGLHNNDAGPDFFNAKIIIGDRLWCGNVEIHVRASDWMRHNHHNDPAYDSVILHVVAVDDMRICRSDGREIDQTVMTCAPDFSRRYAELVDSGDADRLSCADELQSVPSIYISDWLTSLGYERLNDKSDRITALVERFNGSWADALYVTLARALGFGVNSDAFERLALATPLHCLMRHRDSQVTVEGTLFGQAGFLDNPPDTSHYVQRMQQEYEFMCSKFGLQRPQSLGWRMARMRPNNFPHRRIATLASLITGGFRIGSDIFSVATEDDARSLFDISLTGYWSRRYNFTAESSPTVKALSQDSVTVLIINVVAPMLYAYGLAYGDTAMRERAVTLLHSLAAERNSVVRLCQDAGMACDNAFTSQAMIQLRRAYCEPRKCLYCRIGHRLLAARVKP